MLQSPMDNNNNNFFDMRMHNRLHQNIAKVVQGHQPSISQEYLLAHSTSSSSSSSSSSISSSSHMNHSHQQQHPLPQQQQRQQGQLPLQQTDHHSAQQHHRQRSLTYHHSQQQQQQQQQQTPSSQQQQSMHIPMVASMMVNNISTPPSPSYSVIKTEEGFPHHNIDCLVYSPFDMYPSSTAQSQHILRSQRSPQCVSPQQQRLLSYNEVSLMQQRQQHQQQQHQQQQHQMRLQQQRALEQQHQHSQYLNYSQSQQLIYDTTSTTPSCSGISSAMSMPMSMPLSVSISSNSNSSELMTQSPTGTLSSAGLYTPTSVATSVPLFNGSPPALTKDYPSPTATMMVSLQHPNHQSPSHAHAYSTASSGAHPASPKRKRQNSVQHFAISQMSPVSVESSSGMTINEYAGSLPSPSSTPHNTIATAVVASSVPTVVTAKPTSRRSSTVASPSWSWIGSRVDKVKDSRSTRVTKSTVSSTKPSVAISAAAASAAAAAVAAAAAAVPTPMPVPSTASATTVVTPTIVSSIASSAMSRGTVIRNSRRSTRTSADLMSNFSSRNQPYPIPSHHQHPMSSHHTQSPQTMVYTHLPTNTGNVTHPRRAAQNRAAQRTFRNRRKAYIKDMEQKVLEIDRIQAEWQEVQKENREVWRRFRVLEDLILHQGLSMPSFPDLTPFFETEAGIAAAATARVSSASDTTGSNANMTANVSHSPLNTVANATGRNNSQSSEIDGEGEDETLLMMGQQYRHDFQDSGSDNRDEDGASPGHF